MAPLIRTAALFLLLAAAASSILCVTAGSAPTTSLPAPANHKKGWLDPASTNYLVLEPIRRTKQERFFCLARGRCHYRVIVCPVQCPNRKPPTSNSNKSKIINKRVKACFADCSSRCETTCKYRVPNCNGYGSVCYDPRFVGGDGVMFYFHGANGGDFALVSDDRLQINAHFIGNRPPGRSRDFTWVQSLSIIFDDSAHALVLAATRVHDQWDDAVDALALRWEGREVSVSTDGEAEWRTVTEEGREVVVERTAERNSVRVMVSGLVQIDVRATPIGEEENRSHGYGIPEGDAFAHLETQFHFFDSLTPEVEGILGKTYRPDYVSPVKKGVAMPMMGGEDRYRLPSLLSTRCPACHFGRSRLVVPQSAADDDDVVAQY